MIRILITSAILAFFCKCLLAQEYKIAEDKGKFGITDRNGKFLSDERFAALYPCSNSGSHFISDNGKLFLINIHGKEKFELDEYFENLKIDSDTCKLSESDIIRVKIKKGTGLLRFPQGKILDPVYEKIYPSETERQFFLLYKNKKYRFYYPFGDKYSPEFTVSNISDLYIDNELCYLPDDILFAALIAGKLHIMKSDGTAYSIEKFTGKEFRIDEFDMPFLSRQNGKYGYIDTKGNTTIPFNYEDAEWFKDNGQALVKLGGKYGTIDITGQVRIPLIYDKIVYNKISVPEATLKGKTLQLNDDGNSSDYLMPKMENNKFGYTTEDESKLKINYLFDDAEPFYEGLAAVKTGDLWGFIAPTGDFVAGCRFEKVQNFSNGLAAARLNNKWGFINYSGNFIIQNEYDSVQPFDGGKAMLFKGGNIFSADTWGNLQVEFIKPELSDFIDKRDGTNYSTVKIGTQEWMAQNLDYKTENSYYYQNSDSLGKIYGRLYTWEAAIKACPAGWHLPSDDEWKSLERSLGMPEDELNSTDYTRGSKEPAMLKEGGSTGFNIKMTGFLHGYNGGFYKLGEVCIIWTSTEKDQDFAWTRTFFSDSDMLSRNNNTFKKYALPLRCIKD